MIKLGNYTASHLTSYSSAKDTARGNSTTGAPNSFASAASKNVAKVAGRPGLRGARELAEVAKMSKEIFAMPPIADFGLGKGGAAWGRLGAAPDTSKADAWLDTSGSTVGRNDKNPLTPDTSRGALYGGIASTDNRKDVTAVPGQSSPEVTSTNESGVTRRSRAIHTDGSVVTRSSTVEDDGTLSVVRGKSRADGSSTTATTVVAPGGRYYRTTENIDRNGRGTVRVTGDLSLARARLGSVDIDGNPRTDTFDASLLPPGTKIDLGRPTSPDKKRPSREGTAVTAPGLGINPEDLVSDPHSRRAARSVRRDRLGEIDRQKLVLPPRPRRIKA